MENNKLISEELNFEKIKHFDDEGNEFWYARELMAALGYTKWGNFKAVIEKSMVACENSRLYIKDHFAEVGKMVEIGSNAKREQIDYKLTRYACYLIAQNGNSAKKQIALAQTYFAVQTRKQELTEQEYRMLPEDEKRLYTRRNVRDKNKFLFDTAKNAGVKNYGRFNNYGYKGLYNGETAKDIAKRKGISEDDDILDFMGSEELGANLFRITQTDAIIKKKNINNENDACVTHNKVGKAVRNTIKKIDGTMPEELPTPVKSIQELEEAKNTKLIK